MGSGQVGTRAAWVTGRSPQWQGQEVGGAAGGGRWAVRPEVGGGQCGRRWEVRGEHRQPALDSP